MYSGKMTKRKKIGLRVLIILAVAFYGLPLVTALAGKAFSVPVHQRIEDIHCVQLLDTSQDPVAVLKVLTEPEVEPFLDQLLSMKAGRYVNDPPNHYGILTVMICYQDGSVDYIGSDLCAYYLSDGSEAGTGWYYMGREEMIGFFSQYVPKDMLPDAI